MAEENVTFQRYAVYNEDRLIIYCSKEAAEKGKEVAETIYPDEDFTIAPLKIVLPLIHAIFA